MEQQQNNFDNNNLGNEMSTESNKSSSTNNIRSLLDMDTKPSLLDAFVADDSQEQQKVVQPTLVRPTQRQHNDGASLKLPCDKWDHHPLGGIVPSTPPPQQKRNTERSSSIITTAAAVAANDGSNTTTTTALSTGSFEEPYEFYWSGDDASSEVVPLDTNRGKHQQNQQHKMNNNKNEQSSIEVPFTLSTATTTAASVSSVEEDDMDGWGMMDEYMTEMMGRAVISNEQQQQKIAPIGSEANNHYGSGSKKRPNSLKLSCTKPMPISSCGIGSIVNASTTAYEPISPGEILLNGSGVEERQLKDNSNNRGLAQSPAVSYLPYEFNVDRFIADLPMPPSMTSSSLLYNPNLALSKNNNSLCTPLASAPTMSYVVEQQQPITADSPLFTPIVPSIGCGVGSGKDPWKAYYYGNGNNVTAVSSAVHRLQQQQQLLNGSNPWAYP
uniref:Uncharacterized protein n=1 Tax=Globodera pallida TaxID=36090 RepID=A0A183BR43_GLOPA